jgi:hypothetical protein
MDKEEKDNFLGFFRLLYKIKKRLDAEAVKIEEEQLQDKPNNQ